jgi:endonuclease-8
MEEELNEIRGGLRTSLPAYWNEKAVMENLMKYKDLLVCDALLDPQLFLGTGNVIRNEVLYKTAIHPLSKIGAIRWHKLQQLVREARNASLEFHDMLKSGILHIDWIVHRQNLCPRHHIPLRVKKLGNSEKEAYYCEKCQVLYI